MALKSFPEIPPSEEAASQRTAFRKAPIKAENEEDESSRIASRARAVRAMR
jgi:hypothetical protein